MPGSITPRATAALLLIALMIGLPARAQTAADGAVGSNLTGIADYSGEWPFVDAFKASRPWIPSERYGCWYCGPDLDLDADGWVRSLDPTVANGGQVARTMLFTHPDSPSPIPSDFPPAGQYLVLYDGTGTIEYGGMATLDPALSSPGRDVVDVAPSPGSAFFLTIVATDPADHVRNIRVIPPGGACADDPFTGCSGDDDCAGATCELFQDDPDRHRFQPRFLSNVRDYRVLRFMDWMATNDSPVAEPDDYPAMSDAHWWAVPPEILAELADLIGADPWVTLPHQATDAFVNAFATALHDHLDPARTVYVEYSNEVWNQIFGQNRYAAVRGCQVYADLAAGCDGDDDPGNGIFCEGYPWPTWIESCYTAQRRWYSQRSVEIFDIFEAAFAGNDRLVRVMASQTGNTWLHEEYLSWNDAWQKTDALATAPYFGGELGGDPDVAAWTLDQLLSHLETDSVPTALGRIDDTATYLQSTHPEIELVAYEGGQHLVGIFGLENDPDLNALFDAANRDPRMGRLYTTYLEGWRARGGHLFANFSNVGTWSKWGRFTLLEYQHQDPTTSPKWQALHDFMAANPCWWNGCGPGLVFADGFESGTADWSAPGR